MNNKEIYKKTLGFSIRRLLWDVLAFIVFVAAIFIGFLISDKATGNGLIGAGIGIIIGLIVVVIMLRFVSYSYKAGQIAMMTKGVVEGKLPEDVIGAGKKVVKERFTTVAAYFAITGVIKGIFRQIGRGITAIGQSIGGDTGGTVGSTISAVIDTVIAYLCDCCLGWVFYRKDEKAGKATLEGAAIFFKHGKTLLKNLGRIFGMSLVSFLIIGGIFFGIFFGIFHCFPDAFATLGKEIVETGGSDVPAWISDVNTLIIFCSAISGIIFWSILHSTFVRPFILVGVLRNFINSGKDDIPSDKALDELDSKSKKFAKLHSEVDA